MGQTTITDSLLLIAVALLTLWAATQFSQLTGQSETAGISQVYSIMAVISLFIFLASAKGFSFFRSIGINETGKNLPFLVGIGGVVGFISTTKGRLFIAPTLTGAIDSALSFAFVNLIAVFGEEYFFRGALMPSIENYLSAKRGQFVGAAAAILIQAFLFTAWHLVAYSRGSPESFLPLFIFGILQGILTRATGSLAPALGAHFILNLINK